MKVAIIVYVLTGLAILVFPLAGLIAGHIGIYLLVHVLGACAFFIVAHSLYASRPRARTYAIMGSLFLVGAACFFLFTIAVPNLMSDWKLGPGPFSLLMALIPTAVGLAHALALVALFRVRRRDRLVQSDVRS